MSNFRLSDPFSLANFDSMFNSMPRPVRCEMITPAPSIKLEVSENDQGFCVKAEVPGVRKEDVNVKIDGDTVSISTETRQRKEEMDNGKVIQSEFQYGAASRTFSLGATIDVSRATAQYDNGILTLTLPKWTSAQSARIAIQ